MKHFAIAMHERNAVLMSIRAQNTRIKASISHEVPFTAQIVQIPWILN